MPGAGSATCPLRVSHHWGGLSIATLRLQGTWPTKTASPSWRNAKCCLQILRCWHQGQKRLTKPKRSQRSPKDLAEQCVGVAQENKGFWGNLHQNVPKLSAPKLRDFCGCDCQFPSQAGNHCDFCHTLKQEALRLLKLQISIAGDCVFFLQIPSGNHALSGEFLASLALRKKIAALVICEFGALSPESLAKSLLLNYFLSYLLRPWQRGCWKRGSCHEVSLYVHLHSATLCDTPGHLALLSGLCSERQKAIMKRHKLPVRFSDSLCTVGTKIIADPEKRFQELMSEKFLIFLWDGSCLELIIVSSNFQTLLLLQDKLLESVWKRLISVKRSWKLLDPPFSELIQ